MIAGLDRLRARLLSAGGAVDAAVGAELAAAAREALEIARESAPVGDGPRRERRLVDSFSWEQEGLRAVMRVDNPHAAYVEFGTGRRGAAVGGESPVGYDPEWPGMSPQPYMYTAAQQLRPGFARRVLEAAMKAFAAGRNEFEEPA